MSSFVCSLCSDPREFSTFLKLFRHITVFHQNDARFQITCDLDVICGVVYRTFSAYKSHIYRHHAQYLHSSDKSIVVPNTVDSDDVQLDNRNFDYPSDRNDSVDDYVEFDSINSDDECENYCNPQSPSTNGDLANSFLSMLDVKRSYVSFLLQLREDLFLPKTTIHTVSTYIVTLIEHFATLFEQQAIVHESNDDSSSRAFNAKVVTLSELKKTMNEISVEIQNITRNEYQFIMNCKKYFDYHPPEEIQITTDGEYVESGCYISIEKTLSSVLSSKYFCTQIIQNMQQRKILQRNDEDLMLSFRDGEFGKRIDDNSLMTQLYLDDIGLTNPIGAKKDQHKMAMIYFSLEDTPEKYRSQLDCIYLLGICPSNILKVKFITQISYKIL